MSEQVSEVVRLSGAALLELAVDRLRAESPADLPEQVALDRARVVLGCTERLAAVRLRAVADVDRRELFALDFAGSTRGWLRTQPGGENGQLTAARRLHQRPLVEAALSAGQVSARAAEQLCGVLDRLPAQVPEPLLTGVLLDGVGGLLQSFTGGLVPDDAVTPELLAARAETQAVLAACAADVTAGPAQRLEPALVLLASRVTASHLGPGLRELLEALLPDGADGVDRDPYFFELRELLDGDVDVRGHLSPEVGHGLAAEITRRIARADAQAKKAAAAADDEAAEDTGAEPTEGTGAEPTGGAGAEQAGEEPPAPSPPATSRLPVLAAVVGPGDRSTRWPRGTPPWPPQRRRRRRRRPGRTRLSPLTFRVRWIPAARSAPAGAGTTPSASSCTTWPTSPTSHPAAAGPPRRT